MPGVSRYAWSSLEQAPTRHPGLHEQLPGHRHSIRLQGHGVTDWGLGLDLPMGHFFFRFLISPFCCFGIRGIRRSLGGSGAAGRILAQVRQRHSLRQRQLPRQTHSDRPHRQPLGTGSRSTTGLAVAVTRAPTGGAAALARGVGHAMDPFKASARRSTSTGRSPGMSSRPCRSRPSSGYTRRASPRSWPAPGPRLPSSLRDRPSACSCRRSWP
jgi:hypothetical protein